jgi:hypothetical protein
MRRSRADRLAGNRSNACFAACGLHILSQLGNLVAQRLDVAMHFAPQNPLFLFDENRGNAGENQRQQTIAEQHHEGRENT